MCKRGETPGHQNFRPLRQVLNRRRNCCLQLWKLEPNILLSRLSHCIRPRSSWESTTRPFSNVGAPLKEPSTWMKTIYRQTHYHAVARAPASCTCRAPSPSNSGRVRSVGGCQVSLIVSKVRQVSPSVADRLAKTRSMPTKGRNMS